MKGEERGKGRHCPGKTPAMHFRSPAHQAAVISTRPDTRKLRSLVPKPVSPDPAAGAVGCKGLPGICKRYRDGHRQGRRLILHLAAGASRWILDGGQL